MMHNTTTINLSGLHTALLVGIFVTRIGYPFRHPVAVNLLKGNEEIDGDISNFIWPLWRAEMTSHGLATPEESAAKSYAKRAALTCKVAFSLEQLGRANAVASACIAEFANNWDEFIIVTPGAIHRYPATLDDLRCLAMILDKANGDVSPNGASGSLASRGTGNAD